MLWVGKKLESENDFGDDIAILSDANQGLQRLVADRLVGCDLSTVKRR